MIRRIGCISAVLVAGLAVSPDAREAAAHTYFQVGGQTVIWAGNQSIRYLSPTTFPPNADTDLLYRGAMSLWSTVPRARFNYYYVRNDQDYPIDNYDGYSDTMAVPAEELDPGVLGVTFLVNNGRYWYDMDMVFSDFPDGVGYNLDADPSCDVLSHPAPVNGYSFYLVALHELGHALGLGHEPLGNEAPGTPWFVATMNPSYPAGGVMGQEDIVELHSDDRSGCRFLYPHSGPAQPPVADLASPQFASSPVIGLAVPLPFSPKTALPGGVITLRSVIENLGTVNHFGVRQGFYLSADPVIQTSDTYLGSALWDIAFEDAFEFTATVDMPADLPAGTYYLGSILDDLHQVTEVYEDNNAASYCSPLTISRLPPVVNILGQQNITCGTPYAGPAASVSKPLNMAPITWSLDNPPAGMTIHASTGVISWPNPVASQFQYVVTVRATNSSGTDTEYFFLGVAPQAPQIAPIANQSICHGFYVGPTPQVTSPACMSPIINWSLDDGPSGMEINSATGVVTWQSRSPSATPYSVTIRATNGSGNGTRTWQIRVAGPDIDANTLLDGNDVATFCNVLIGVDTNSGHVWRADQNFDGVVNSADVRGFMDCYLGQ